MMPHSSRKTFRASMREHHRLFACAIAAACAAGLPVRAESLADCDARPRMPMSLADAEHRFERCNRDVRAAEQALAQALADRRVAGQRPNPTVTLAASNVNPHVGIGAGTLRDKTFD